MSTNSDRTSASTTTKSKSIPQDSQRTVQTDQKSEKPKLAAELENEFSLLAAFLKDKKTGVGALKKTLDSPNR